MAESQIKTKVDVNVINLKENVFMVPYGTPIPKESKKMLASSFRYMSEPESKWYVKSFNDENKIFVDYTNPSRTLRSALRSFETAVRRLSSMDNVMNFKFLIYSID